MTKPEWLPRDLWPKLLRYRDPWRHADPTEGFLLNCASHAPGFEKLRELSDRARIKAMLELLEIPPLKNAREAGTEDVRR